VHLSEDRKWKNIRIGEELPQLRREITQDIINRYATASEDPNPLHFNPEFAKTTPFKGTIAHGTMYLAYVSQLMMQWFPLMWMTNGQMEFSFLAPSRPGDILLIAGKVTEKTDVEGLKEIVCEITCRTGEEKMIVVGKSKIIWGLH
jgi:3-hydroxybutyryl-CoA dehydratase